MPAVAPGYTLLAAAGAAEGLITLGMSYLLSAFSVALRSFSAAADSRQRAACFTAMAALVCPAPYQVLGLYPARCLAALAVLLQAHRKGAAGTYSPLAANRSMQV